VSAGLTVRNRQRTQAVARPQLVRITRTLLREILKKTNFDLGIYLVNAHEMTRLNIQFLKHGGSTDVITFDYFDTRLPELLTGEIFVCVDEALAQARRFRTSWQSEVIRYVVHGILHLCGYDDRSAMERRRMKREENRLVKLLGHRYQFAALGQTA
jgi:probable rRNA maturation factor